MAGVQLEHIAKRFGALEVIRDVNLEVNEGEFVVLVGPSGCGKSTTLRMIAGLEEISDGLLTIDGRTMNNCAPKDRDVAMVFQNYALYPHLNAAENIGFGLRIRGQKNAVVHESVGEVAEVLGLTEYLERRPADLSGGQRQRVAMGRAIVRQPKVFLFDEPLSNLDAKLRIQMRAEIKRLHNRLGATSVYVTHDQVEAMTLADRIVVMNKGDIAQVGTPMELFLNPANTFVASFLGSPPMNLLPGVLDGSEAEPTALVAGQPIKLRPLPALKGQIGRDITVGVRPEYVELANAGEADQVVCDVDLVETLGSEALVHAHLGQSTVVLKSPMQGRGDHLSKVTGFRISPDKVRLFDAESGQALSGQQWAESHG